VGFTSSWTNGQVCSVPHLWLDEAMEGPVPSTILRNSVVVATGAWVQLAGTSFSAFAAGYVSDYIHRDGGGGSLIAIAQIDAKRALSYSPHLHGIGVYR